MKQAVTALLCAALLVLGIAEPVAFAQDASPGVHPRLVDGSFDLADAEEDAVEEDAVEEAEEDAVEETPAVETPEPAPAVEASPPPPVVEAAPLVQDAPVTQDPIPSGTVAPSSGTDSVTLLIVAAGGFAVGLMAGVMGCCVLFFAYYY